MYSPSGTRKGALNAKLEKRTGRARDYFAVLAQAALQSNTESFLTLAQEKLRAAQKDGEHDLSKRSIAIEQMVKPVEAHFIAHERYGRRTEGHGQDDPRRPPVSSQGNIQTTTALRNPSAQGKWGRVCVGDDSEKANLQKGLHYDTQLAVEGGGRPDVIINLHDGFKIAIDSKAPISEYIARLDEDLSEGDIKTIRDNLARAVRGHVKALGARSLSGKRERMRFRDPVPAVRNGVQRDLAKRSFYRRLCIGK